MRVVIKAIMAWLKTRREIIQDKIGKRNAVVADLDEGLKLYVEICKAWIIKSIKHPLLSLIRESSQLNLNFLTIPSNNRVSAAELSNRLMKAKVRLKGILKGIVE